AELLAAKNQVGESKEAAVAEVFARMEKNIELLGCTGIDDKYIHTPFIGRPGIQLQKAIRDTCELIVSCVLSSR
ncbi:putative P-type ATPase, partial [Cyclospora cayetanensis]